MGRRDLFQYICSISDHVVLFNTVATEKELYNHISIMLKVLLARVINALKSKKQHSHLNPSLMVEDASTSRSDE